MPTMPKKARREEVAGDAGKTVGGSCLVEDTARKFVQLVGRARGTDVAWFAEGENFRRSVELCKDVEAAARSVDQGLRDAVDEGLRHLARAEGASWDVSLGQLEKARDVLGLEILGNVTVKWHTSQTFMPSLLDVLSRPASEQEEGNGTAATAQHRDRAASILLGRTRKRATAGLMLCSLASMHSHCPPNSSMDYPSRPSVVRRKAMARLLRRRFMSSASEACTDRVRAHLDAQPKDIAETLLWVLVLPPTQEECNEITGPPREGSKWKVTCGRIEEMLLRPLTLPHTMGQHPWLLAKASSESQSLLHAYSAHLASALSSSVSPLITNPGGTSTEKERLRRVLAGIGMCILEGGIVRASAAAALEKALNTGEAGALRGMLMEEARCVLLELCGGEGWRRDDAWAGLFLGEAS